MPYNWVPVIRFGGLVKTVPGRYNQNAPWADKRVRQALNYAVDREGDRGETYSMARRHRRQLSNPAPEWFDLPGLPVRPQKAKELLAEAGYPSGFEVTLRTFASTPGAELPMIGQAVAMYWEAIGVKVKIVPTDEPTVRGAWTGGKATDYLWTHRGLAFSSAVMGLQTNVTSKSVFATYATEETEKLS